MKVESTNLIIRETKDEAMARIAAAKNSANNNGANNDANSNTAVAQSKVVKTDTVELSKKSVELSIATATKGESKVGDVVDKLAKANEKAQDQREDARQAMSKSQQELRKLVKGLKKLGMGSRKISSIVKTANREANKVIGKEIKEAYNDYRSKQINKQSLYNKLYGAAIKKLDGMVSALRNAYEQKLASVQSQVVTVKPIETPEPVKEADDNNDKKAEQNTEKVKETANETKSDEATNANKETRVTDADDAAKANAEKNTEKTKESANETRSNKANKATKETRVTDADDAVKANAEKNTEKTKEVTKADDDDDKKAGKTTPPGLAKKKELATGLVAEEEEASETPTSNLIVKEEKVVAEAETRIVKNYGSADNMFSQIVDFFNDIDKMVNGFADKMEDEGNNDKDDGQGLTKFASKLSKMFSGINRAFGNQSNGENVGHRLGMAQAKKETISQLFDSGHGSGAINRIGDAGEGSGNFNAVSFMSSLSNSINEGLENYKDMQKTEKESEAEAKEAVGTLA